MRRMNFVREMWEKGDKKKIVLQGSILIVVLITEIVLTVLIPEWKNKFFNVLQQKDYSQFTGAMILFVGLMLGLGIVQGLKTWVGQLFSFAFRISGSKILLKKWVKSGVDADNHTEAQTSSLNSVTELPVRVASEVFISGAIVIMLIVMNIGQPAIVISATIYTMAIMLIAKLFNRPLVGTHHELLRTEGKYREAIGAIHNGKGDHSSKRKFLQLVEAYYTYIKVRMGFNLFSAVKGSLATLVPYLLMAPKFFDGTITLGEFMAAVSTFELIVVNSTIIVLLYPEMTKIVASWKIVNSFYKEVSNEKQI